MVCTFGDREQACLAAAHATGGKVRVGLEHSRGRGNGHRWTDNAKPVTAVHALLNPTED